ncbi:MAG: 50S ribosomal protein L10 [Candidatus Omnitrophota bacterium]
MAKIGKICKEYMIEELTESLKASSSVFVTDCNGLSCGDLRKLRGSLKGANATYVVVKNSLGKIALKNAGDETLTPFCLGTVGLTLGGTDPVLTSKALLGFAKEFDKLKIKCGILDGKLLTAADIKELSQLPSREVLLARMCGGMKAPITGFVNVLHGTLAKIVYAVQAIKEKKEKEGKA